MTVHCCSVLLSGHFAYQHLASCLGPYSTSYETMSLSSLVNGSVATTIFGSEPASITSQESYQDLRRDLTSLNPSQTSVSPDAPSVNRLDSCPSSFSSCWRESEVKRILQGHDLESIQLVCRFNPFEDETFAESLLRDCQPRRGRSLLRDGKGSANHYDHKSSSSYV